METIIETGIYILNFFILWISYKVSFEFGFIVNKWYKYLQSFIIALIASIIIPLLIFTWAVSGFFPSVIAFLDYAENKILALFIACFLFSIYGLIKKHEQGIKEANELIAEGLKELEEAIKEE